MILRKKMRFDEIENIAQQAIKAAFKNALNEGMPWITKTQEENLFREAFINEDTWVFEILTLNESASNNSKDIFIVAKAIVNQYTGELLDAVSVYLPPIHFCRTNQI